MLRRLSEGDGEGGWVDLFYTLCCIHELPPCESLTYFRTSSSRVDGAKSLEKAARCIRREQQLPVLRASPDEIDRAREHRLLVLRHGKIEIVQSVLDDLLG